MRLLLAFLCVLDLVQGSGQKLQYEDDQSLVCSENDCPPGLFCGNDTCKCGVYPKNKIVCSGSSLSLLNDYCMTFDEESNVTVAGDCMRTLDSGGTLHNPMPPSAEELNSKMCAPMQRTGILCGRCLPNHYPLAYSYNMTCIKCPNVRWNWVRYIMAAYLPLTLFYICIVFFHINITSSHMFPVVYYCQTLSMPILIRLAFLTPRYVSSYVLVAGKLYFSLYGIWNLDFFRPFYSDLCLGIGILPTLALDYAIAVYPLLLMIISYLLIVLYDRNYRVVTIMWRPFRVLFSLFRRNWDVRTSVVDAFATFFFLTNMKLLSVSFDFIIGIKVYYLYPEYYNYRHHLYYAVEEEYCGGNHLPYFVMATILLTVLILLPIAILVLYPLSLFQKFLNLFPVRWHILRTFVDSFHGCYKDGTEPGTSDYRWFAAVFFVARITQYVCYALCTTQGAAVFGALSLLLLTIMLATLQPFSATYSHYNTINIIFLQLIVGFVISGCASYYAHFVAPSMIPAFHVIAVIFAVIPLLCISVSTLYWIYLHRKFGLDFITRIKAKVKGYSELQESLPDRIEHSNSYPKENLSNFAINTQKIK